MLACGAAEQIRGSLQRGQLSPAMCKRFEMARPFSRDHRHSGVSMGCLLVA
jgi:hypothetical protein